MAADSLVAIDVVGKNACIIGLHIMDAYYACIICMHACMYDMHAWILYLHVLYLLVIG